MINLGYPLKSSWDSFNFFCDNSLFSRKASKQLAAPQHKSATSIFFMYSNKSWAEVISPVISPASGTSLSVFIWKWVRFGLSFFIISWTDDVIMGNSGSQENTVWFKGILSISYWPDIIFLPLSGLAGNNHILWNPKMDWSTPISGTIWPLITESTFLNNLNLNPDRKIWLTNFSSFTTAFDCFKDLVFVSMTIKSTFVFGLKSNWISVFNPYLKPIPPISAAPEKSSAKTINILSEQS